MTSLPELDITPLVTDPDGAAARAMAQALREVCHRPGFCYVRGHGVEPAVDQAMMSAARRFFALPEAERREIAIGNSPHFRGYTILGDERTGGRADWRDQIDFGPEDSAPELSPGEPAWRRLRGPNQWPRNYPQMRAPVVAWMAAMERLGLTMMRALAVGLGLSRDTFDAALTPDPYPRVKVIRYPALPDAGASRGLGMHHDSGLLTFILQDAVGGLEVQTPEGLVQAEPRPGTYIMNLGEMLQRATGGYLRATAHGVRSPPPGQQRISIAYFFNPRLDAVFEPLQLPEPFARQAPGGENDDPSDPVHATFGENTLKIRMRAHPDVTRTFYSTES